jgi:hypothetical protein
MYPLPKWVLVIDEIQKVPKLLDVVHYEIEKRKIIFALTGSSARKLKKGALNLLAGKALLNNLYPLSHRELNTTFNVIDAIACCTLPFVVNSKHSTSSQSLRTNLNFLLVEYFHVQAPQYTWPRQKFKFFANLDYFLNAYSFVFCHSSDFVSVLNSYEIFTTTYKVYATILV